MRFRIKDLPPAPAYFSANASDRNNRIKKDYAGHFINSLPILL
jgi:hypothetical protein